jgi:hypothetical protein
MEVVVIYLWIGQRAGLSGFSFNNIPGVLQARNFLQGVPLGDGDPRSGGFLSRIGKGIYWTIYRTKKV